MMKKLNLSWLLSFEAVRLCRSLSIRTVSFFHASHRVYKAYQLTLHLFVPGIVDDVLYQPNCVHAHLEQFVSLFLVILVQRIHCGNILIKNCKACNEIKRFNLPFSEFNRFSFSILTRDLFSCVISLPFSGGREERQRNGKFLKIHKNFGLNRKFCHI